MCDSTLFHIRRKPNISLKAYDSKVFQIFVDAFRVCRQIRTDESLPPRGRWHGVSRDGRSLRDFEI